MTDRLSGFLTHFDMQARVFNTGPLCGVYNFNESEGSAHLHLINTGVMRIDTQGQKSIEISEPSLLFYLRPTTHSLVSLNAEGANAVCATIDFGLGAESPLAKALPPLIIIKLSDAPSLTNLLDLFFEEAFNKSCGRQSALDRYCEIVIIHILRYAMQHQSLSVGMLAGMADPRIAKALIAIHNDAATTWTLELLAQQAGMSRARFAVNFRETVGLTPGEYLTAWRLAIAQSLLKKGRPANLVANDIGYSGAAAFARLFKTSLGVSPREWLKQTASTESFAR